MIIGTEYMIISIWIFFGIIGLGIGSFLNVVIFRMETEKKFWNGRSECMNCHHTLAWYELIPVLSYILQRGKCRECEVSLSPQYPLVEIGTSLLFGGVAYLYAPDLSTIVELSWIDYVYVMLVLILVTQLMIIFVYDVRYQLIPAIQLRAIQVLGLIWFILHYYQNRIVSDSWLTVLLSVGIVVFLYIVTKKQGIGWGDIELFAGLSFFIPFMWFVPFFFGSFIIGTIWGLTVMIINHNNSLKQKIAFGPSIIVSFVIMYSVIQLNIVPSVNLWYYLIIPNI